MNDSISVVKSTNSIRKAKNRDIVLFGLDVEKVLDNLPEEPLFDLVVTSPPYDIGKSYEKKMAIVQDYFGQPFKLSTATPEQQDLVESVIEDLKNLLSQVK